MAEARQLLTDIRLQLRQQAWRPVYTVATDQRRVPTRDGAMQRTDLGTVSGRDNLGQAILLRLLTPRGELAGLETQLAALRARLANESFTAKAPPAVVAKERDRLAAAEERAAKLRERLVEVGG